MLKSELVTWSPTFSVGVKLIDEQHQELLKITNDLFNHCVGDEETERAYLKKVIKAVVDYVKVHFSTEEKIMRQTEFPGYAEHKREHDAFVLTVVEQIRDIGEKKFSLISFTRFLKNWILTHIAVSDKQYAAHLKKTAARKDGGHLSITGEDPPAEAP
jgi:hemerythrin